MQPEEVFHGRLDSGLKCPMVTENDLGQDAWTLKCNSFILLTIVIN